MSALEVMFGADQWDGYVDWRERFEDEFAPEDEEKHDCLKCLHCVLPLPKSGYQGIGYCEDYGDFVFEGDTAEGVRCGEWL